MTIKQMLYYAEVCRCGNITKAASNLFVSQPALSKTIKEIEASCGTALFVRSGNKILLTEEGNYLYGEVQEILAEYNKLESKINNHQLSRNHIRLGYSVLSGFSSYIKISSEFSKKFPETNIKASINNTATNYELLDSHKIDIAITSKNRRFPEDGWNDQKEYGFWPLTLDEVVFCTNSNNNLAKKDYIDWDTIGSCKLILLGGSFSVGKSIAEKIRDRGFYASSRILFTEQIYVALQMIKQDLACGFFPKSFIEGDDDIAGIPTAAGSCHHAYLVWRKDTPLFWAAKEFINLAKKIYPKD